MSEPQRVASLPVVMRNDAPVRVVIVGSLLAALALLASGVVLELTGRPVIGVVVLPWGVAVSWVFWRLSRVGLRVDHTGVRYRGMRSVFIAADELVGFVVRPWNAAKPTKRVELVAMRGDGFALELSVTAVTVSRESRAQLIALVDRMHDALGRSRPNR